MAITLIPVAVIPQIILSGVIASLSGLSKNLAQTLITVYWGNRGLDALLTESQFKRALITDQGDLIFSLLIVLAHALVFILTALVVLSWQGRRAGVLSALLRRRKTNVSTRAA
jgi:hypothetical protein